MEEKILLNDRGVLVTSVRYSYDGVTIPLSAVFGVRTQKVEPGRKGPGCVAVLGVLALVVASGPDGRALGLMMFLAGLTWWKLEPTRYEVRLVGHAGETAGLVSRDEKFVARVRDALNEAITYRG